MKDNLNLHQDRYFSSNPKEKKIAQHLYSKVKNLPLICPHGHVNPELFVENMPFPDPTELLVIPDHYLFRMLYSQGVPMESMGIPPLDGSETEKDHRRIWQVVADHFYLFRGTPTGMWLKHEMHDVFEIKKKLNSDTAMEIYDRICENLRKQENHPREMFERFNIEILSTTDSPEDTLEAHQKIRKSGWNGKIIPAFRPDSSIDILNRNWKKTIDKLSEVSGIDCSTYRGYIEGLEKRRAFFKEMGATTTDHGVHSPYTVALGKTEAERIFNKAQKGKILLDDAKQFIGHMLMEMARMSVEDGMTMQIHAGVYRNHNKKIMDRFGPDMGCDIPIATNFVNNLKPLLNRYGNDRNLNLIIFTIDESTYSRELAPLAGHYPAMKLGPAWWFNDSREGMLRFRRLTTETAGIYNTVGFIDDTRAFPSIPARHDLARRIDARYLAELVAENVIDPNEAEEMVIDLAYRLPKKNYKFK